MEWIILVIILCILSPTFAKMAGEALKGCLIVIIVAMIIGFSFLMLDDCSYNRGYDYEYEASDHYKEIKKMPIEAESIPKQVHKTPKPKPKEVAPIIPPITMETEIEYTEEEE